VAGNIFQSISIGVENQKIPAVEFLNWHVPEEFACDFHSTGILNGVSHSWYLSLNISVAADGAPRATGIKINSEFQGHKPKNHIKPGLSRWQLEAVESNLHNLLASAMELCVSQVVYKPEARGTNQKRWAFSFDGDLTSRAERKKISKESQKLSHRRVNSPEHLEKVAKIYAEEVKRSAKSNTRGRMTQEVMIQMNTKQGTAELWIRNAQKLGLIKARKASKTALNKSKTTSKKGN
jgi:hypothetical protein